MPIAKLRSRLRPVPSTLMTAALLTGVLSTGAGVAQQQPPEQTPPTADQKQQPDQNALRATAFAAENQGRFAAAADAFLALCKLQPDRVDWVVAAGRCLGRSGRYRDAIDLLDAAQKRFPGFVQVQAMLARTLLLQAEREPGMIHPEVLWADAAALAEGVLAVQPDHEDCRLLLAQARYLQGDLEQATAQAEEAVRRHPERSGAHVLLGRLATDRFRALLAELASEQPTGQQKADLVAAIDAQRQRATGSYRRAAELDPDRAFPHVALSQLASLDGQLDEARQHVLTALAIDPDVAVDHDLLTRGQTWQQRRDLYRQLRERYESTTTTAAGPVRKRKAATLWFHQGRANLDGQDWQAARDCFQRAAEGDPTAENAHYYWFLSAYYLEDHDQAEQQAAIYARASAPAFADVLRALPAEQRAQIAAIVQFLGDRAYRQQRIDSSRDLNHVIACLKDSADAWNNHAFLCRETGHFDDAYTSYLHAIEKEPNSPQLWNDAGVVLQYHLPTEENLRKARTMYDKALELAGKVLADPGSSAQARTFALEAQQNARANLAELDK